MWVVVLAVVGLAGALLAWLRPSALAASFGVGLIGFAAVAGAIIAFRARR